MSGPTRNVRLTPADGLYTYNTFHLRVVITGLPSGVTLSKAWLTLKALPTDVDPGVLQKTITTTLVAGSGQITDDGTTDQAGALAFIFTAANTAALTAGRSYPFDVKVLYSNGEVFPVIADSTMIPGQGLTQATT